MKQLARIRARVALLASASRGTRVSVLSVVLDFALSPTGEASASTSVVATAPWQGTIDI